MSDCFPSVRAEVEKAGLKIDEPALRYMHEEMQSRLRSGMNVQDFASSMEELIGKEMVRRAESVRAAKLMQLAKVEAVGVGFSKNKTLGLSAHEYLRAIIEGGALKSGDSVNISARGIEQSLVGKLTKMYNQLDKIRDEIESGKVDRDILQEIAALQGEGKVGATGNKAAQEAARVFKAIQQSTFDLKRARNPMMRFNDQYYIEQTHSREKLSAVTKEEWIASIESTHGQRSFPDLDPAERTKALGEIYDSVTSGTYGSGGGGNILFSMARGRTLIPNDWKAFADYHAKFGEGTVAEVMHGSIRSAAREISRLEKFGPEWRSYLDKAYAKVYENASPEERLELAAKKQQLTNAFKTAIGDADAPAVGMQAKLVQGSMAWLNMSLNSAAVVSSIPDFALQLGLIQDLSGKTQIEIAKDLVSNMISSATNPAEARVLAARLGLYAESNNAALMRELGTDRPVEGFKGKAGQAFKGLSELHSKLTLMNRYLEASKSGIGITIANILADASTTKFADLPQVTRQSLGRYGIGAEEWSALKYAVADVDFRGKTVRLMDMESVDQIPDGAVEAYMLKTGQYTPESADSVPTKEILDHGRSQLAIKLGVLINEQADLGTSTAGTRQRTFLQRGLSINDGAGQLMRLLTQFKSAGLVSTDVLRRRYYSGTDPKGSWAGVAQTGMTLLFFGAIAEYAHQALDNKTPEDPRNPDFILKTMARSGAMGPWSDTFISEVQRNGVDNMMQTALTSFAGPVIGKAVEGTAIGMQSAKEALGEATTGMPAKYPQKKAFRLGLSLVPGQNLFWAQGALNYYFLNGMRESLNHGMPAQLNQRPGLITDKQQKIFGEE